MVSGIKPGSGACKGNALLSLQLQRFLKNLFLLYLNVVIYIVVGDAFVIGAQCRHKSHPSVNFFKVPPSPKPAP